MPRKAKTSAGKVSAGKVPAGKVRADKLSAGNISPGKVPVDLGTALLAGYMMESVASGYDQTPEKAVFRALARLSRAQAKISALASQPHGNSARELLRYFATKGVI